MFPRWIELTLALALAAAFGAPDEVAFLQVTNQKLAWAYQRGTDPAEPAATSFEVSWDNGDWLNVGMPLDPTVGVNQYSIAVPSLAGPLTHTARVRSCVGTNCSAAASVTWAEQAPVDCVVSSWTPWTTIDVGDTCDATTGTRPITQRRTRTVLTQPSNGGAACPVLSEQQTLTEPCPVDCTVSAWSDWSPWTPWTYVGASNPPTEERTQTRSRTVTVAPLNGGAACPALTETTRETRLMTVGTAGAPAVLTVAPYQCWVTLAAVPPDTNGGWRVQFQRQSGSTTTIWTNFGPVDTTSPYQYSAALPLGQTRVRALWMKTGQPTVTSAQGALTCK